MKHHIRLVRSSKPEITPREVFTVCGEVPGGADVSGHVVLEIIEQTGAAPPSICERCVELLRQAPQTNFEEALAAWLAAAQEMVTQTYSKGVFAPPTLSCEHGKRYVRVIRNDGSSRSAYAFVDMTNGNVLKPDGWKRPAKHARGNIYTGPLGVTGHGAQYFVR